MPWRHIWEWKYSFTHSSLDESEGSTWLPSLLNLGESTPDTHWIGGWVDDLENRKLSYPLARIDLWFVSHPALPATLFWLFKIRYSISNNKIIIFVLIDVWVKVQNVPLQPLDRLIQWTTDSWIMLNAAHKIWWCLVPTVVPSTCACVQSVAGLTQHCHSS
jgi:hypothetical protein